LPVVASLFLAACLGNDDRSANSPLPPGGNSPPSISGTPPTSVAVGQAWTFQPTISDPDGDRLTVSAAGLPGWLTLNASTGRVSGTPSAGDVRNWSGISLSVSDGQATASLGPFSVNVIAQGTGSATLSWMPPTQRVDGSPIGELAGYEVLWGQRSRDYDHVVELDAGVTRYVVENLGPGTWYFAIRSRTTDGLESGLSGEASKRI
jgi:hypothetical protein